jgi:hypothetical protein
MRYRSFLAAGVAVFFGLGLLAVTGCGGSSGTGGGGGGGSTDTPTVNWSAPAAITYGAALSATQLNAAATYSGSSVAGTYTYSPAAGTVLTAGSQTLNVTFTPSDTTTYNAATAKVTLTVNQATLAITANSASRAYGASNPAFTYTPTGFVNGDSSSVLSGSPSLTATATPSSPPGSYPITAAAGTLAAANYNFTFVNSALTVSQAGLTITASSPTVTYGSAVPAINPSYAGFVNGDAAASLTTAPACSTTYTATSAPGTYPSTCSGAVDANYAISYTGGVVTVNPAGLTITASSPAVTYGSAVPAIAPSYAGFVNGNTAASLTTAPACSTTYTATSTPGTYPSNCSGAVDADYAISYTAGLVTVSKATPTVTTWPTASAITTGQTLASSTLTPSTATAGGAASVNGTFAWTTPSTTPSQGTDPESVTFTPSNTTDYNTVTDLVSVTVNAAGATDVTVNPSNPGIAVTDQILGMNMAAWYDEITNKSAVNTAFAGAGIKAIRWPGGSWSDAYHWGYQSGSSTLVAPYQCECSSATKCTANSNEWAGYNTFAQFVSGIPLAGSYDLALTANYGTNEACSGGGDPNEAAAWVAAAANDGLTVSHMTVGNEEYGNWETDLHSTPNDPTIYAAAVVGAGGYYDLIKAASASTLVGVDVDADDSTGGWDNTVLANAKGSYDFVEYHYYPETPGEENDTTLIESDAQALSANIKIVESELTKWGTPGTPIYVGEIGGPYSNPGKQSWSITQGLYAGEVLGEMMKDGVSRLTWWISFGNCNGSSGNDTSSVYGWQTFGAYNVFSDGNQDSSCDYGGNAETTVGTMSPTAIAFDLFSNVAVNGEHVLTPAVTGDTTDVRAYAATHAGGTQTALVLFNLNKTTPQTVQVTVTGESNSPGVTEYTYDKEMYDYTNTSCEADQPLCSFNSSWPNYTTVDWVGPATNPMGTQTLPMTVTLAPWSINVFIIQ